MRNVQKTRKQWLCVRRYITEALPRESNYRNILSIGQNGADIRKYSRPTLGELHNPEEAGKLLNAHNNTTTFASKVSNTLLSSIEDTGSETVPLVEIKMIALYTKMLTQSRVKNSPWYERYENCVTAEKLTCMEKRVKVIQNSQFEMAFVCNWLAHSRRGLSKLSSAFATYW